MNTFYDEQSYSVAGSVNKKRNSILQNLNSTKKNRKALTRKISPGETLRFNKNSTPIYFNL
jgi:hypothetical protein